MLIKEYRILIPLTVDEYRIAQLYMIQKKSQAESTGAGSGVEIIKNEPYTEGPNGKGGQYTFKLFHVGSHLPNWFRSILPKSALAVEEEAWNAYPFTKTRYKVQIIEKFTIDIETYYFNDFGENDNVFNLTEEEQKVRIVEFIDIVNDPISKSDYVEAEDPTVFKSVKTGRGPLTPDWRNEYKHTTDPTKTMMCAYKLCRIEFKYWGMQTKIEGFIDEVGLRKTMLRAHRQAWCWQDEYHGMTIQDIRNLEEKAKLVLAEKMHKKDDEHRDKSETVSKDESNRMSAASKAIQKKNTNTSGNIEAIQRQDSLSDDDDDDDFEDAKSEMPSDTDSFITCKNTFASNLTLHIDPNTGLPLYGSPLSPKKKSVLILVLHGGSLLDTSHEYHNKNSDISTLRQTFDHVVRILYPSLKDRLAIKLVACPSSVNGILNNLSKLTPQSSSQQYRSTLTSQQYIPLAAIPLILTQSAEYKEAVKTIRESMNDKYNEFLRNEGFLFDGPVNVIADPIGSLFLNDILQTKHNFNNGYSTYIDSDTVISASQQSLVDNSVKQPHTSISSTTDNVGNISSPRTKRYRKLSAQSQDSLTDYYPNFLSPLEFPIHQVFLLGSPLGLVMSFRETQQLNDSNTKNGMNNNYPNLSATSNTLTDATEEQNSPAQKTPSKPWCRQLFNIFHQTDPSAYRLEPLINSRFHSISPYRIQNYHNYLSQQQQHQQKLNCSNVSHIIESNYFIETLFNNPGIVLNEKPGESVQEHTNSTKETRKESINETESALGRFLKQDPVKKAIEEWWGQKRIDYCLHTPDGVENLPLGALPHVLHASYWESRDCAAFILRQIVENDLQMNQLDDNLNETYLADSRASNFDPDCLSSSIITGSSEYAYTLDKTGRLKSKSSSLKFKTMCVPYKVNVSINHRANDVIVLSGQSQILSARFVYGALDIVVPKNQKVDVFIMTQPIGHGHWEKEGSEVVDANGRVQFHIPESRRLVDGIYPIRMVLKSDWSAVDFHLAVLPKNFEVVVFSIDGSFAASVSISGKDPKIRAGCIDVARFWYDRGYLLLYISARPSLQQRSVQKWLAEHKFPFGMLQFSDGMTREPIKQKMHVLSRLIKDVGVKIHCAYGSAKDISIYQTLGLHSHQIFSIGRLTKNQKINSYSIKRGYANHLNELMRKDNPISKSAHVPINNLSFMKTSFDHPIRHIDLNSAFYKQNYHDNNTVNRNNFSETISGYIGGNC